MHNKNTSPSTILEMYVSLPALTETCFEVNTLGEFAPDRSVCTVGGGIEGGDVLADPATSYQRDLIEYMTADACGSPLNVSTMEFEFIILRVESGMSIAQALAAKNRPP